MAPCLIDAFNITYPKSKRIFVHGFFRFLNIWFSHILFELLKIGGKQYVIER